MARKPETAPFEDWAKFGLPAFASALAPWQDKLTGAELITEYFQPRTSIIAALGGVLVCYCIFFVLKRSKRRTLVRLCIASLIVFFLAVIGCFWLVAAVDIVWFPDGVVVPLVQVGWQVLFVLVFVTFSTAVATTLRLR